MARQPSPRLHYAWLDTPDFVFGGSRYNGPARDAFDQNVRLLRTGMIRLGDVVDDYCPRCKLLLNHAVASMVDVTVVKVVCQTCHTEHPFRTPWCRSRRSLDPAPNCLTRSLRRSPRPRRKNRWRPWKKPSLRRRRNLPARRRATSAGTLLPTRRRLQWRRWKQPPLPPKRHAPPLLPATSRGGTPLARHAASASPRLLHIWSRLSTRNPIPRYQFVMRAAPLNPARETCYQEIPKHYPGNDHGQLPVARC